MDSSVQLRRQSYGLQFSLLRDHSSKRCSCRFLGRITYQKDVEVNGQWITRIRWIVAVILVVGCGAFTSEYALGAKNGETQPATDTDESLQPLLRDTPKPNYGVPEAYRIDSA